jgi:tetratricopeptide (TPR) repeat protein
MTNDSEGLAAFDNAIRLHGKGRLIEAEKAYLKLLSSAEHRKFALDALSKLYLQIDRPIDAANALIALTEELPLDALPYARLAALLDGLGETDQAIAHYRRLISRRPDATDALFNIALLCKKAKRHAEALDAYTHCLRADAKNAHEIWSNMGIVYYEMHRFGKAEEMYHRALQESPEYLPALFNLAGLFEEKGVRSDAIELYGRILEIEPTHCGALSRLAYVQTVTQKDDKLIGRIQSALMETSVSDLGRETLYFALGKINDDLGNYEAAFEAYQSANNLGSKRCVNYDRIATEKAFELLKSIVNHEWLSRAAVSSNASPIFICGMFRSGSTLTEHLLATHADIIAGGELDILPWLIGRKLSPFPQAMARAPQNALISLSNEYINRVQSLFPNGENVTDKRPDNFVHLGLIKVLFPKARIIYTKRKPADNALSIYFQQLERGLGYATNLDDIAHYRAQHDLLLSHWMSCFGDDILIVDYDDLVREPSSSLRNLFDYIGLRWDGSFSDPAQPNTNVATASLWQVRQEVHSRSSGRWRNYERYLAPSNRRQLNSCGILGRDDGPG